MMDEDQRVARLARLEPFVGDWRIEAPPSVPARTRRGGPDEIRVDARRRILLQRSSVPVPGAPDGLSVIGPDGGDGYTQHYFDSRGSPASTR